MPKMNGVQLTENLYKLNVKQCVIVLSAHDESQYLLPLINLGIQQFIKKPIDSQELLDALLKASKNLDKVKIECNLDKQVLISLDIDSFFNAEKKSLIIQGENIYLTKYEILFMQLITLNIGTIYSNENIVEYFNSQGENMDIQNIRKLVSKLRKKLPENCLESIYGIGYRLSIKE
jgi:DNA-binding response OmpR family regulator